MARVTIEDCTEKVPNRFHLVQMAAIRTKQLKKGALALLSSDENKPAVVALREIAAGFVKPDYSDPTPAEIVDEEVVVEEVVAEESAPAEEAASEE